MLRWSGALALGLVLSQAAAAAEAHLTGAWSPSDHKESRQLKRPDPKAPEAPPAPAEARPPLPSLRIVHQGAAVVIESLGDDGRVLSVQRLTTDGAENVNKREAGLVQRSRSRWDGQALTTKWRLLRRGRIAMTGVEVWTLSNDRNTLTQTSALEDARSRTESRTVYARKQE